MADRNLTATEIRAVEMLSKAADLLGHKLLTVGLAGRTGGFILVDPFMESFCKKSLEQAGLVIDER